MLKRIRDDTGETIYYDVVVRDKSPYRDKGHHISYNYLIVVKRSTIDGVFRVLTDGKVPRIPIYRKTW